MFSVKHCNIPIFIPQKACPHQCIYCNQKYISGKQVSPTLNEVKRTIEQYLFSIEKGNNIQVAFFGGTFTGLDFEEQRAYLETVRPYIISGKVHSVRLSTRPDYINSQILELLKQYDVKDIELGAQSLDDDVLSYSERGHTSEDVIKASQLIKSFGFNLGLQMMIGLPKDTLEKSIQTAKNIISLGATSTRIYPTLVIDRTTLATYYKQGKYRPLTINEAVCWTKEVYKVFKNEDITVLRVGLHPSKEFINGKGYLAGPFHVSFFELVLTSLWKERFEKTIHSLIMPKSDVIKIIVNPKDVNYAIGYNSSNLKFLREHFANVKFLQDESIAIDTFAIA